MSLSLNTLLHQIQSGSFRIDGGRVVFLNAMFHSDLSVLGDNDLTIQQHFKPYENALVQAEEEKNNPNSLKKSPATFHLKYGYLYRSKRESDLLIATCKGR